jgi:hypothetical protein
MRLNYWFIGAMLLNFAIWACVVWITLKVVEG